MRVDIDEKIELMRRDREAALADLGAAADASGLIKDMFRAAIIGKQRWALALSEVCAELAIVFAVAIRPVCKKLEVVCPHCGDKFGE